MTRTTKVVAAGLLVLAGLLAAALPVAAADQQAVQGMAISGHGTLLVASSNQMTVYTFTKDVANSGKSNCTGQCLTRWPALTVAAGATPTAAGGIGGTLGTIVRSDNGQTQVTFNGLPLYFFSGDSKPGDANGIYPNWLAVPVQAVAAATAPASSIVATSSTQGGDPAPWLALAVLALASLAASTALIYRRRSVRG